MISNVYFVRSVIAALLLLTFLNTSFNTSAQTQPTGTITGTVKDANGNPLSGASVTVEGTRAGTFTDATGSYSIRVAPGTYTLLISFVGQTPQRFRVTVPEGGTIIQSAVLAGSTDLSDVVVVGSRSRLPRSKLNTPVPVDVISAREVKQFAQTDVSQLLTFAAPSFQSARQTISDGTDHIDPAGLRGLGPDQTLVLLNGKRRHTTALVNINGTVGRGSVGTDMNAIPVAAIERIEVLRDGAAAQYGSDAIAGVINIVLKKNYKGFNISGMAGQNFTEMPYNGGKNINDGLTRQIDFSGGYGWKNGAYVNVSGQWLKRDGSNRSGLDNIPLVYYGNAGSLPGVAAVPAGVDTATYYRWLIDLDKQKVNERKYDKRNIVAGNSSSQNLGAFINAGLPITSNISLYTTLGASHRTGAASGFSRNPNSWSQQPVLANGQRFYYDGFLPQIHTAIDDYSALLGVRFNFGEWDLDVSNTNGQNNLKYTIKNTGNASLPATDDVQTEFYAGKLSFLQNTVNADASRKFELNEGQALNVAFGGEYRLEKYKIFAGEPNSYIDNNGRQYTAEPIPPYPGTPNYFPIPGGPAVPGAQVFPGFQPADQVDADRDIYAGYIDLEYTRRKFLLGAAARYETYKEFQVDYDNLSWKVTGRYDISSQLAVRASVNTGFRAPSLHQRFFQNTSTQFVGGLPSQALTANNYNTIVRDAFGIQELKPEKSMSYTAGLVGNINRNLTITVDAYYIKIKDRIVLSTQFARSNPLVSAILNANGAPASVNALQFWTNAVDTETKGLDVVVTNRFRLGKGNGSISLAGNFNRNDVVGKLNTNSVIDDPKNNPSTTDPNANPANDLSTALFDRQQRSRIEVVQPRTKINATLTYDINKWNFVLRAVRFGKVKYIHNFDPESKNPNTGAYFNDVAIGTDQEFGTRIITDLVVSFRAAKGLTLSVGGNNIFDVYPEKIFVDPRNDPNAYYANPLLKGSNKTTGGYNAARDASNRGRFLFPANQFGFNGRFLFARLNVEIPELYKAIRSGKRSN